MISQPYPAVDVELAVISGRIELTGTVRAELTDVVAQQPNGERLELGDLSIVIDCWTCSNG